MCFMNTILQCIEDKLYLNEQLSFIELCLLLSILGYFKMHMPGETFLYTGTIGQIRCGGKQNLAWSAIRVQK